MTLMELWKSCGQQLRKKWKEVMIRKGQGLGKVYVCVFSCILAPIWNESPRNFQFFYHKDSKALQ